MATYAEGCSLKKNPSSSLFPRLLAAMILAPLGIWVVVSGGWPLVLATAMAGLVSAFEWGRMATGKSIGSPKLAVHGGILALGVLLAVWAAHYGLALLLCVAGATAIISLIVGYMTSCRPWSQAFGGVYITLPFGAFVILREVAPDGLAYTLAIMLMVWISDSAAYLAGKGFGGPLLYPANSPNKTWSGAIGALCCTMLAGVAMARLMDGELIAWGLAGIVVSFVSQAGDLLESGFKRRFGVKDASGIIPGHGGVLDRLDGLMAAVLLAALIAVLAPALLPGLGEGRAF